MKYTKNQINQLLSKCDPETGRKLGEAISERDTEIDDLERNCNDLEVECLDLQGEVESLKDKLDENGSKT